MSLQLDYSNDKGVSFPAAYWKIVECSLRGNSANFVVKVFKDSEYKLAGKHIDMMTFQAMDILVSPNIYDTSNPPLLVTPAVFKNHFTDWFKAGAAGNEVRFDKRGYQWLKSLPEFIKSTDIPSTNP